MFNWNPEEHDRNIPERPELVKVQVICKCGCDEFTPIYKINFTAYGNQRNINFEQPPVLICVKCGSVIKRDQLMEKLMNVGKATDKLHTIETSDNPQ